MPCGNISRFVRGGTDGFPRSLVPRRRCLDWPAPVSASSAPSHHHAASVQLADVFRAAHAKLDSASPVSLSAFALAQARFAAADRSGLRESVSKAHGGCGGGRSAALLLVVDNSFSMRAGTRLADAKREALSVLASRKRIRPGAGGGARFATPGLDAAHSGSRRAARRRRKHRSPATPARILPSWSRAVRSIPKARALPSSFIFSATCRNPSCRRVSQRWPCRPA